MYFAQQCFGFTSQANFPPHNLNFHHSPSNRIVCYRVAFFQDLVLAYRAGGHDAALSYDAARAGKNKFLHCGYVIKLYSM